MGKKLDLILFGATGFTGRLVATHLVRHPAVQMGLRWGIAGRNLESLDSLRMEIGASSSTPLIVADSKDPESIEALARKAHVICSTVGPYQLYGEPLVAACAQNGSIYLDLCGEANWVRQMIDRYSTLASHSGAQLYFSSGFDSVPFELGVMFVQEAVRERFGEYSKRVRGRVRAISGSASGGTLASGAATMAAIQQDTGVLAMLADPFALTPGFKGPAQPELNVVRQDALDGAWLAPWVMAVINTKNVHRSNMLLGHPWGKDFVYDEMLVVDGPNGTSSTKFDMGIQRSPGDGPDASEMGKGFYDLAFIADTPDGATLTASVVSNDDPGYGSTAKILVECALAALRTKSVETRGGCFTIGSKVGSALIGRMESGAGLKFFLEA